MFYCSNSRILCYSPVFMNQDFSFAIRMPNMKSAFYKGYKSFRTSYAIFLNVIYDSMALLNLPRELYLYNCIYLIFFFEHFLRMLNNTLFNFMYILSLPRRHVLKQTQLQGLWVTRYGGWIHIVLFLSNINMLSYG